MATMVTEIELTAPLVAINIPAHYKGLFALLRRQGRPVGLLRMPGRTGHVDVDELRAAIETSAVAGPASVPGPAALVTPAISIVICTHERPEDLERCLTALQPMAAAGHEVIVVDNAPRSGRTAAVAAGFPFLYVLEARVGLDNARNAGLHVARHPIVAFVDDDAMPDPAWAAMIAAPFADPAVACVTGLVLPLELETAAQEAFETYCVNRRTFQRREFVAAQTAPATAGVVGMGANMAIRRELALRIGGFDPRLDAGTATRSGGDTDMFARVLDTGARIVYSPDALVWHRHRRSDKELRDCLFGYGVGLYSFLSKRLTEQGDRRTLSIGLRWWFGPMLKAGWRALRGKAATTPILLAYEAVGAFYGPLRFRQETLAQHHHVGQQQYVVRESMK